MLHDAPWLSIAHLPTTIKTIIAQHLAEQLFPTEYQTEIQKIVEFMLLGVSHDSGDLLKNIRQLDTRRNESLTAAAPELSSLLKYE
jgi:hypothetical protein